MSSKPQISIYLRHSAYSQETALSIHVPAALRPQFIAALQSGSYSGAIEFEMSVLPEWTDGDDYPHITIPVNTIAIHDE